MSPPEWLIRAGRTVPRHLRQVWNAHVRLLRRNEIYEALWVAAVELLLQQRINLHRLVTQMVLVLTRRWAPPETDY